jgi:hypothetical protein
MNLPARPMSHCPVFLSAVWDTVTVMTNRDPALGHQ